MEVEKINIQGVQPETEQTFQGKKSVQSDIRESHDEEKRNAAKLMTGAAALAAGIAAGIICHRAGVFQKLRKMVKPPYVDENAQKFSEMVEKMERPISYSEFKQKADKLDKKAQEELSRRLHEIMQPFWENIKNRTKK